ncbi:MAG: hypothetical protein ACOC0P_00355, partial [Planctomycetota bacterium]
ADDGNWYFSWPDTIPGLDVGMPKTETEWKIVNNMLVSINNGLTFAENRIESGDFNSLEEIWEQIGREVGIQVGGQAVIYGQVLQMRDDKNDDGDNANDAVDDASAEETATPPMTEDDAVAGRSG